MRLQILLLALLATLATSYNSDNKFLKKYALIKIFESCFGPDVVKDIRRELKLACMKCQALDAATLAASTTTQNPVRPIGQNKLDIVTEPENSIYGNSDMFPMDKLHQTILAFRPNPYPQPSLRPYPGSPSSFYQAFANQVPLFYSPNYPTNPFASSQFGYPYYNQQYSRMSRDMDVKEQWESLLPRLSTKVRNITCVMQELGYIDDNLEPNYAKINKRIASLPVAQELKTDIQDGVNYCQQFSQCVPEPTKASPLSRELTKPMLFFKCYKYKKLEACIMKDVREKISNITEEGIDEEDFRRTGKSMKNGDESEELASTMYDLLYGGDTNFDNIF